MSSDDTEPKLLRCTKCNSVLAATEGDKEGFEIPVCNDCYHDLVPGSDL